MTKPFLILLVMIGVNTGLKAQNLSLTGNITYLNNSKPLLNSISNSDPGTDKNYDYYMKKSKNYRTVGWSTLIGGVVLSGIGLLISASSSASFNQAETGVVIMGIGALSGIVSIPFMISASVNKHKAKLILENQKTGFGAPSNVGKNIPGVTLVMPVGK